MVTEQRTIKAAVVGAGAIGGISAAYMVREGWDIELVTKHQDIADLADGPGLHVFGVQGDDHIQVPSVARIDELSGPKDIIFLATKALDMVQAVHDLELFMGPDTLLVSMQNGVCEEVLASELGPERIIGCVVGWGATMHSPGELEITSIGDFIIGAWQDRNEPRLELIQEMLASIYETKISNNILGALYGKLIINSCITPPGAVCGLYLGEMLAIKKVRRIFLAIMREAMAVAEAMELKVEPIAGGKIDYYKILDGSGFWADLKRDLFLRLVGFKYKKLKSSSLQSLQRGRPTEIGYLNGYICQKAREHEVPAPVNTAIVRLVKEIEAGKRQITPDNFMDPAFDGF